MKWFVYYETTSWETTSQVGSEIFILIAFQYLRENLYQKQYNVNVAINKILVKVKSITTISFVSFVIQKINITNCLLIIIIRESQK